MAKSDHNGPLVPSHPPRHVFVPFLQHHRKSGRAEGRRHLLASLSSAGKREEVGILEQSHFVGGRLPHDLPHDLPLDLPLDLPRAPPFKGLQPRSLQAWLHAQHGRLCGHRAYTHTDTHAFHLETSL